MIRRPWHRQGRSTSRMPILLVGAIGLWGCTLPGGGQGSPTVDRVAGLQVVDCLLPGQVRRLGTRTYQTARRPVRTTAADCEVRGGEYVAYDRADYTSALAVWLPTAEAGDPEAQTNVGEIYERGLGGEPDLTAAARWYRRAAEQGFARAQFNLGTLYEQGRGVPLDTLQALNWYRQAWGLAEDDLVYASAAARERRKLKAELEQQLEQRDTQIRALERRLGELEDQARATGRAGEQAHAEAEALRKLIDELEDEQIGDRRAVAAVGVTRAPPSPPPAEAPSDLSGFELGRYVALLIGNAHYKALEDLSTPLNDIAALREVLEQKYGFQVFVVADGDNATVMSAINDVNDVLSDADHLLLYYAGHGSRLPVGKGEVGYWLPANAEAPPRDTFWVPNEFVTRHLARLRARHVLVVADSCYAGLLSNEPSYLLLGERNPRYADPEFMRFKLARRARLLLASGGDRPVLDASGGRHSIFANAFLEALESNDGVLAGPELFVRIRDRMHDAASVSGYEQVPEFKAIKAAGHEVGDFYFVPLALR